MHGCFYKLPVNLPYYEPMVQVIGTNFEETTWRYKKLNTGISVGLKWNEKSSDNRKKKFNIFLHCGNICVEYLAAFILWFLCG